MQRARSPRQLSRHVRARCLAADRPATDESRQKNRNERQPGSEPAHGDFLPAMGRGGRSNALRTYWESSKRKGRCDFSSRRAPELVKLVRRGRAQFNEKDLPVGCRDGREFCFASISRGLSARNVAFVFFNAPLFGADAQLSLTEPKFFQRSVEALFGAARSFDVDQPQLIRRAATVLAHDASITQSDLHFDLAPIRGRSDGGFQFADVLAFEPAGHTGKSNAGQSLTSFQPRPGRGASSRELASQLGPALRSQLARSPLPFPERLLVHLRSVPVLSLRIWILPVWRLL